MEIPQDKLMIILILCFFASLIMLIVASLAVQSQTVSIGQLSQMEYGEKVIVNGIISNSKESYNSITFTICDTDNCVKATMYDKSKRYLSNGDAVTVIGTLRQGYIAASEIEYVG